MKYLVVIKESHYPSVYEFDIEQEAIVFYETQIKSYSDILSDVRIYFTKIEKQVGDLNNNVIWQ